MAREPTSIDKLALRRALGNFVTGVTIVTTFDELGRPRGLTANSFTSVSLDPPLVLVCIANTAGCCEAFKRCHSFVVNLLHEDQHKASEIFATTTPDKFDRVNWSRGAGGAPRIVGSLAIFECEVHDRVPAGDHFIIIGRIVEFESAGRRPLVYGQGGYISVSLQQAAVGRPHGRTVTVNCIAEHEGRVVLVQTKDGGWVLPGALLTGSGSGELISLEDALRRIGAKTEITFLYSVFDDEAGNGVVIVYRGTLSKRIVESDAIRLFGEDEVPWEHVRPAKCVGMLQRFFRERAIDQFGIYDDVTGAPRVARLNKNFPSSWESYVAQFEAP